MWRKVWNFKYTEVDETYVALRQHLNTGKLQKDGRTEWIKESQNLMTGF
jgi:hypothetical protein